MSLGKPVVNLNDCLNYFLHYTPKNEFCCIAIQCSVYYKVEIKMCFDFVILILILHKTLDI